jgi:hypothetical protein
VLFAGNIDYLGWVGKQCVQATKCTARCCSSLACAFPYEIATPGSWLHGRTWTAVGRRAGQRKSILNTLHAVCFAGVRDQDNGDDVNLVSIAFAWADDDPETETKPMSTSKQRRRWLLLAAAGTGCWLLAAAGCCWLLAGAAAVC